MIDELIRKFYEDVWQSGHQAVADEILHPDLRFRGSIGIEKHGPDGFWEYFEIIRGAFGEYRCDILELVARFDEAAAKLRFSGMHRREFLGVAPTWQDVSWKGTAFFKMKDDMLIDIWVLGDMDGLRASLAQEPAPHQVDVYWSLQSPYCYFLDRRLQELAVQPHVDVHIKPVRPGVLRLPDRYRDRDAMEMAYFDADTQRTAAFLDLDLGEPRPSPVEFLPGTWTAAPEQPRIDRIQRMLMVAVNAGKGVDFVEFLSRQIWDGSVDGWDSNAEMDKVIQWVDLHPADVRTQIEDQADALDAQVLQNEQDMYAAGHWGVPLTVYRGEAFYGQDRWDQLLWRIEENE